MLGISETELFDQIILAKKVVTIIRIVIKNVPSD